MQDEERIVVGGDEIPTHLLCVLVSLRTPTRDESFELHRAICERDICQVALLLRQGLDPRAPIQVAGEYVHNILTPALTVDSFARVQKDLGGNMELTKLIIEAKADVNQPDTEGSTPLIFAIRSNFLQGVKVLLQMRADPQLGHFMQNASPLYYAANTVSEESVCLLRKYRADPREVEIPLTMLQYAEDYRSRIRTFVEAVQENNAMNEPLGSMPVAYACRKISLSR
eukprot:s2670_g11.t1